MRLAYFGTPDFAVPTLERLLAGRHPVVCVVSQPDRRRGRGRATSPSPESQVALDAGIPLLRPEQVGAPDAVAALAEHEPDLGVVAAFGQFLPRKVRELPRLGYLVNAHASLLPRHRGAAPIAHAILAGDATTGISVMRVEREMDAGPVARVDEIAIGEDETTGELTERLAQLAAHAIGAVVDAIAEGGVHFEEQDHARATLAPRIERADAVIDWKRDAGFLARLVRAMAPRPGATTWLDGEPLRILAARAAGEHHHEPPGRVRCDGRSLRVAAGVGWLYVLRLQRSGGAPLDVDAFLRGRPISDGIVLGVDGATP